MNHHIEELITQYPELKRVKKEIIDSYQIMKHSFQHRGKLLLAGNGGSAADCEHIVGELMKGFVSKRTLSLEQKKQLAAAGDDGYLGKNLQGALPAISLVSHTALMTAISNDVAADLVFAQQVYGYGRKGDVFLGISTSGNSKNIVEAMITAKSLDLKTIALTGKHGGKLKEIADVTINVPYKETYQVQERHLPVYHTLCLMLEEEFFG